MLLFGMFAEVFYDGMSYIGRLIKETGGRIQRWGEDLETYMTDEDHEYPVVMMDELEPTRQEEIDDFDVLSKFPK
jgi:hypothetical protein